MSTLLPKADIPNGYDEWGFLRLGTIFAQEKFSLCDASLSRSTSASKVSMSEARYREVKRLRTPLKRDFDIRPNRLAVQTWLTQSGVNTHRGFAMLTVVFLAAIFACFQLLGMWLRLKAMEQKFDYLMELLLAPTTEEQPPRQN